MHIKKLDLPLCPDKQEACDFFDFFFKSRKNGASAMDFINTTDKYPIRKIMETYFEFVLV